MNDAEALELTLKFALDGREGNADWREKGRECQRFVKGKQWNEDDELALEEKGVVPLTINHCLPIRDNLCGRERQNRKDIKIRPNKGGNTVAAGILTALNKHAMDASNGIYEKSEMFKDGATTGRGWLFADTNYENDIFNGDIEVRHYSGFDVDPDPLIKEYNPNISGRYINVYEWVNKEEIEGRYPDAVSDLEGISYRNVSGKGIMASIKSVYNQLLGIKTTDEEDEENQDVRVKPHEYRYRICRCWFKQYEQVVYWIDKDARSIKKLTSSADIAKAKKSVKFMPERFSIKETVQKVLYKTVSAGNVLLETKRDPFGFTKNFAYDFSGDKPQVFEAKCLFPGVPFYPYFEDGETFGKIDNLIGPQKEENKRRTQFLRIINSVANSGWMYEENALTPEMKELLETFGSRPGICIEHRAGKSAPARIQPVQAPNAHLTAAMASKEDMKEISSVNNESLAYKTPSGMSGYAIALKQSEGMTGNEIVFDNFDQSSQLFAELLTEIIRCGDYYSEQEIRDIIDEANLVDKKIINKAAEQIGPPPVPPKQPNPDAVAFVENKSPGIGAIISMRYERSLQEYQNRQKAYSRMVRAVAEEMVFEQVRNIRVGKYGVRVSQSPNAPTVRMAKFAELLEIDKAKPGSIPVDVIIEASDMANKDEIIEKIQQQQQAVIQGMAK